ncbi:hypothetical protein PHET_10966 [Paragonimus heterotremus]|uniref:Uncharacterized protein n=1 Tax=Paragonimus heterotremus TaxID=100268 RepID=A0A8J4WDR5_9TREM|nr:hypothetical protein PHET_10966 [Paragonimus heterotremus]
MEKEPFGLPNQYLQDGGEISATTSTNVSNATSTRRAKFGIAMGKGKVVAKSAFDMV